MMPNVPLLVMAELSAFLKLVITVLDSPQMEPVSINALMTKLRDIHYV